jgi:hypothetical protein
VKAWSAKMALSQTALNIAVIDGFDDVKDDNGKTSHKGSQHGHLEMWDGDKWVSDFEQTDDIYPGPGYRAAKPDVTIYRSP